MHPLAWRHFFQPTAVTASGIQPAITLEAVNSGRINISAAAKLAELAKEDQTQLDFDDIKAIQDASKAINKAKFEVRRQERLQAIEAKRANNKPLTSELGNFGVVVTYSSGVTLTGNFKLLDRTLEQMKHDIVLAFHG